MMVVVITACMLTKPWLLLIGGYQATCLVGGSTLIYLTVCVATACMVTNCNQHDIVFA